MESELIEWCKQLCITICVSSLRF